MKSLFAAITTLLSLSCGALTLNEVQGNDILADKKFQMTFPTTNKGTVLVFVSAKCPCSASHEEILKDLQSKNPEFAFVGVHANADESKADTLAHFKKTQFPFAVIEDAHGELANKLGALKTPHAFVFSPQGELLYRGGVTDSHVGPTASKQFLREVLEDLKAGKTPRHKEGRALGCYIQREEN